MTGWRFWRRIRQCVPLLRTDIRHARGFTLLELSIVLVVIGFLTAAVMVGRDMIGTANLRRQIGQVEEYNGAMLNFVARYSELPGDFSRAATYGMTSGSGNGNNRLQDGAGGTFYQGENAVFFQHLTSAQLIDETFNSASTDVTSTNANLPTYFPRARIGRENYVTVFSDSAANYYEILAINTLSGGDYQSPRSTITPLEGDAIDRKLDDAQPLSGLVRAITDNGAGEINTAPTPSATGCVLTGGTKYNTGVSYAEQPLCRLRIAMPGH